MDNQDPLIIEIDVTPMMRPRWQRVFYVPKMFKQHYAIIRKNTSINRFYAAYVALRLALLILR